MIIDVIKLSLILKKTAMRSLNNICDVAVTTTVTEALSLQTERARYI